VVIFARSSIAGMVVALFVARARSLAIRARADEVIE
jgi:hypothetical protein